jgi:transportin-1
MDKLCEDIPKELEKLVIDGRRPLDFMIPAFLSHASSQYPKIRCFALSCVSQFISTDNNALTLHLEPFMTVLFSRASDDSADVRKTVCQSLVQLLATRPAALIPEMPSVVEFMLFSTKDEPDEEVALEACEFWLTFAEDPALVHLLKPYLPKVVPVLLERMIYSDEDIALLDTEEDDAAVPDRAEDIKPHLLASKARTNERAEDAGGASNANKMGRGNEEDEEEEDDDYDEDDDEEDEDDAYTEWNLRKCSAAALDVMAVAFEADLLEVLLPYLKTKFFSENWLDRESGILALGAIAEGELQSFQLYRRGVTDERRF